MWSALISNTILGHTELVVDVDEVVLVVPVYGIALAGT